MRLTSTALAILVAALLAAEASAEEHGGGYFRWRDFPQGDLEFFQTVEKLSHDCRVGDHVWRSEPGNISQALVAAAGCSVDKLRLHESGSVGGRYVTQGVLDGIAWVEVFACSGFDPDESLGAFPAQIDNVAKRWSAQVPAGCLDITLHVASATPTSLPSQIIKSGEHTNLASIVLDDQPRLLVRVIDADTGRAIKDAHVALGEQNPPRHLAQGGWLAAALKPGEYKVSIWAEGYERVEDLVVDLSPREEVRLRSVTLRRLGSLIIQLLGDPERLSLSSLQLELARLDDGVESRDPMRRSAEDGFAAFESILPGEYALRVFTKEQQGGDLLELVSDSLRILPGEHRTVTVNLEQNLRHGELVDHEGGVSELTFFPLELYDSESVMPAVRSVRTDSDGRFSVVLPSGSFRVRGERTDESEAWVVRTLEVLPEDTFLTIRRPGARVSGRVRAETGMAILGASVSCKGFSSEPLDRQPIHVTSITDHEGSYICDGLEEGRWIIAAVKGDSASEQQEIFLDNGESESVDLHLRRGPLLTLQLIPAWDGPTQLFVSPVLPKNSSDASPIAGSTNTDGRVEFQLPPGSLAAVVQVFVEGGPAEARRLTLPFDGILTIPPVGQPVDLDVPPLGEGVAALLVRGDGGFIGLSDLAAMDRLRYFQEDGVRRVRIVGLSSGEWSLATVSDRREVERLLQGSGGVKVLRRLSVTPLGMRPGSPNS